MVNGMIATSLPQAIRLMSTRSFIPYAGGTDLMIDGKPDAQYLFLHAVPELRQLYESGGYLHIGAACTYTEALHHPLVPKILKAAVSEIAAPAVRNLGTFGGNIGNGSAKADSALVFSVTDSLIRLASTRGERITTMREFYRGRKELDLEADELIVEIMMPSKGLDNYYYHKVGARQSLAISRVAFAALLDFQNGKINNCAVAFGAISEVILRRPDLDALLIGKTIREAKIMKGEYLDAYSKAIQPISGRISSEYRKTVCMNLLRDFLEQNGI